MRGRLSGGGSRGRRRARTGRALPASGPGDARESAARESSALETALAAALLAGDPADRAEQQAVAAFRAVRAAGPHPARTRRRDDWRSAAQRRRARRPAKVTFGAVFAGLALGGVAVAAVGSAGSSGSSGSSSDDGGGAGRGTARPSVTAPGRPGGAVSSSPGGARPADRPDSARDTEAHCRAYEQVQGRGKALDATAWRRLVAAAGGEAEVAAYCSEQLARATSTPGAAGAANGTPGGTVSPSNDPAGNGTSGGGTSGNGTSGTGASGTGASENGASENGKASPRTTGAPTSATGNDEANAGQSGGKRG